MQDPVSSGRGLAVRLVLAGILATFVCGALVRAGETMGLIGSKPIAELLVAVVLFWIYPEKNDVRCSGKQTIQLISFGAALALFWIVVFAWGRTVFPVLPSGSELAIFIGVLSAVFTAPLFEEKVVRHLLLVGGAGLTRPWVSAILVSVAFAVVHKGSVAWSFAFSLVLCWLALARGMGTLQRAIIHATVNALIVLWYFTSGFGLHG